jgi:hypothetical protein
MAENYRFLTQFFPWLNEKRCHPRQPRNLLSQKGLVSAWQAFVISEFGRDPKIRHVSHIRGAKELLVRASPDDECKK